MKRILLVATLFFCWLGGFSTFEQVQAQSNASARDRARAREEAYRQYLDYVRRTQNSRTAEVLGSPITVQSVVGSTDRAAAVQRLFGAGVTATNVTVNCFSQQINPSTSSSAFGTFDASGSALGATRGVVLTTGRVFSVPGPNNSQAVGLKNNVAGDPDFRTFYRSPRGTGGGVSSDACAIEFDAVFATDTVIFRNLIFGSEEYPEYENDDYNDAFLILLRAQNGQYVNIATVPDPLNAGQTFPISVNSINRITNTNLFRANSQNVADCNACVGCATCLDGTELQFDGLTVPLVARAVVVPGQTYHIKIVIADTQDDVFDSGLFIEDGSITVSSGIATGLVTPSTLCASGAVSIPFSAVGTFNNGNVFTAELSDATGSFATPVVLGSITSTATSGTIAATIPANTEAGTGYRIRVVSSNPARTGSANGADLTINTAPVVTGAVTNILCNSVADNTGSIALTINPDGGQIAWSNGQTTATISNLQAGNYTVTVTNGGACSVVQTYTVLRPTGITIRVTQTNVSCVNPTGGSIDLTPADGTEPYTYQWSTNVDDAQRSNEDITGLGTGTYTVTVSDATGCTGVQRITILDPEGLLVTLAAQYNVRCANGNNGSIDISVSGGRHPYSYSWSRDGAPYSDQQDVTGLTAATYAIVVTDADLCTFTRSFVVSQPQPISISVESQIDVNCPGDSDGSVRLNVTCGVPPYTYRWSNGTTTQNAANLPAGTYTVTVTDGNGCTAIDNVTITQPARALELLVSNVRNVTTFGGSDGRITVSATGGTSPYRFSVGSGFTDSNIFQALRAGTYIVSVQDAKGCVKQQSVTVTEPSATCAPPTNLQASNITFSSARLAWTGASLSFGYEVDYRVVGTLTWTTTDTRVATPTVLNISNLVADTRYEARVRNICQRDAQGRATLFSGYTSVIEFRTLPFTCQTPQNLTVTNTTTTTASFSWTAVQGVVNYEVQIKLTADASYTTFLTTTTSYTAVGLTPGSSYDVRIRTRCSSVNSDYTTPLTFPTQADAACAAPTGLAVTNITANAARLSWNAVAGATQYEVNYRLIGAVEWIERLVTGTVDNLTNLQAGSRYEFRVAAICGTVNGAFPNPIPFQTSTGTSNCVISPDNVRVTSITPTTAVVTWDAVVPSQGYQVEIRRVGAANWTNDPNVFTNSKSFSGLVAGTSYDVRVRTVCARSGTGFPTQNSGYSQELRINTPLSRDARAASAIGGFGLFPNPNNGVFTVTFFTERSGVADLAVYDVTGREVIRAEVVTNTGRNEMPVNLTGYARGVYTVRFIFEGAIQSAKVELH